jgi:hypothetical protein
VLCLDGSKLTSPGGLAGVAEDRQSGYRRRDLLKQLRPFPTQAGFVIHETGDVATRPRQAGDEAGRYRIGDYREHDGTVRVASSNGLTVESPWARMTSGASATNSTACLRMSAALVVAQRMSIRTLRPMLQPNCDNPCRNAPTRA